MRTTTFSVFLLCLVALASLPVQSHAETQWSCSKDLIKYNIASSSMEPTLREGTTAMGSCWGFALPGGDPSRATLDQLHPAIRRGDIVSFWTLDSNDKRIAWIKRVIGLPGDRVAMKHGILNLDGRPVPRKYEGTTSIVDGDTRHSVREYRETLPDGASYDIVKTTDTGAANNTGTYTVPPNDLFVLGDNRDNSADSRYIGYVPASHLIARVEPMQEWLPQCDSNVAKKGVAKAIADNVASHIINLDLLRLDNIKEIKRETRPCGRI